MNDVIASKLVLQYDLCLIEYGVLFILTDCVHL